jgi:hypothetical protein
MSSETHPFAIINRHRLLEPCIDVLLPHLAPIPFLRTIDEPQEVPVVLWQFGLPHDVRRRCTAERTVQPRQPAYVRRVKVEQHLGHARLRQVTQPGTRHLASLRRPRQVRRACAHADCRGSLHSIATVSQMERNYMMFTHANRELTCAASS